jgi:hypothetical protein
LLFFVHVFLIRLSLIRGECFVESFCHVVSSDYIVVKSQLIRIRELPTKKRTKTKNLIARVYTE